ncbi:MAG: hypothetical protein V2I31_06465 [Mariniphaga sp.]|jgi:hypothetical protein|nr:hypothetical protein [Mariniphaga sp.]
MAKKISEMNNNDFNSLVNDFYAEPKLRNKLTEDEVKALAERINGKVNIPVIGESGEEKILIKIILKIDNFMYDNLPNEFYDLIRAADKGIDEEEAKMISARLTKLANEKINLPFLSETAEEKILGYVIEMIMNSATKNQDLNKVLNKSE